MSTETLMDRAEKSAIKLFKDGPKSGGDSTFYVAGFMQGYIGMPHNPEMAFPTQDAVIEFAVGVEDGIETYLQDAKEWGISEVEILNINGDGDRIAHLDIMDANEGESP